MAQENRDRQLKLEVKLREAEAVKAREKGKEATAAARKEVEEARLRVKEQARSAAEEKEAQSRLRLKLVAKLCGELNVHLGDDNVGRERIDRAGRLAVWRPGERRFSGFGQCPSFGRHQLSALRK